MTIDFTPQIKEFYSIYKETFDLKREFDSLSKDEKKLWEEFYFETWDFITDILTGDEIL